MISPKSHNRPIDEAMVLEPALRASEWGMASFLLSEVAFFGTLIVTYIAFIGRDTVGPTPAEALSLPIVLVSTLCLLLSSLSIHLAEKSYHRGNHGRFRAIWTLTIALGVSFLVLTCFEWHDLIVNQKLTISRNLFGTTYFTLVGFHALHVTVGVFAMSIVLGLVLWRSIAPIDPTGVRLVAWYWHFVDAVWIIVFLVVYVASRSGPI